MAMLQQIVAANVGHVPAYFDSYEVPCLRSGPKLFPDEAFTSSDSQSPFHYINVTPKEACF